MPLDIDGKEYPTPYGMIRLYPIAKLSQALIDADVPRDTQTIRKWEIKGVTPPAIFRRHQKRLYSLEQIECIVRVAKECGIRKGVSITDTDFIQRVWEELSKVNEKYKKKQ